MHRNLVAATPFLTILAVLAVSAAALAGLGLLGGPAAQAADGTWSANAAGNWSDTTKWTGGNVADGADSTATFSDVINNDRIVTLDSIRTIGHITASDTSNNYTISGSNALTLDVTSLRAPRSSTSPRPAGR